MDDQPKEKLSAAEIAKILIDGIQTWPVKHGDYIRQDFVGVLKMELNDVFDEIRYFLSFSADFAFHCMLKDKLQLQSALRDAFNVRLRTFILEHGCKPVPYGEWLGDTQIWMTSGEIPAEVRSPLANLDKRFSLYTEVLTRGKDKPAGESLAYVLAALCGTTDIAFITAAATGIFSGQLGGIRYILDSVDIIL